MGQFDSETGAALAELNYEALSETPGGEFAEIVSDLLTLIGTGGLSAVAGSISNLALKVRKLAGASYGDNLIYAITAVRNDLADLYQKEERLRGRIDSLRTDPKFAKAIAALALRAMQTSVEDRLRRLARIIVNGVKEDDLEAESIDDMMRAAVELKGADIVLLGKIYDSQKPLLKQQGLNPTNWFGQIQTYWNQFVDSGALNASNHLAYRSSFSRLESHGLIQKLREISTAGVGLEHYALLEEGLKFYERLQEIAVQE
jgi:hypothetical protein